MVDVARTQSELYRPILSNHSKTKVLRNLPRSRRIPQPSLFSHKTLGFRAVLIRTVTS